jgi:hypothetical protein
MLAAALLTTGCASKVTQVIVTIDAEPGVRTDSTRLHLVVLGGVGRTTAPTASRFDRDLTPGVGDPAYPFKLALAPLDGDVGRSYSVTATALAGSGTGTFVGQARLIGGYVEGETLNVRLLLEDACRTVACGDEQTCKAGVCVDARTGTDADAGVVDAGLPDGGPPDDGGPPEDGGRDAGLDGSTELDGGVPGITLSGDFVSGAASGSAGGMTLRGAFSWTGNVSGSAGGITLRGHVQ